MYMKDRRDGDDACRALNGCAAVLLRHTPCLVVSDKPACELLSVVLVFPCWL